MPNVGIGKGHTFLHGLNGTANDLRRGWVILAHVGELADRKEREKGHLLRQVVGDERGIGIRAGDLGTEGLVDREIGGSNGGFTAIKEVHRDPRPRIFPPNHNAGVSACAQLLGPSAIIGGKDVWRDLNPHIGNRGRLQHLADRPANLFVNHRVAVAFRVAEGGNDEQRFALAFRGKCGEKPALAHDGGETGKICPRHDCAKDEEEQDDHADDD